MVLRYESQPDALGGLSNQIKPHSKHTSSVQDSHNTKSPLEKGMGDGDSLALYLVITHRCGHKQFPKGQNTVIQTYPSLLRQTRGVHWKDPAPSP
jgi:hypothetical protein